jgi:cystathionine gamma-lyase
MGKEAYLTFRATYAYSVIQYSNANAIAIFLESHQGVTKVVYPGLKSHPQHEIAKVQQHGFGAMITFYCVGGRAQSAIVLEKVSFYMS